MAVALDHNASGDAAAGGAAVSTLNLTNFTIGSGTNRALVVCFCYATGPTAISVKWDTAGANQSLTNIISVSDSSNGVKAELWGLVNPTSGTNKTITASWTTTTTLAALSAVSFTGVNQTGGATSFAHSTSNTGSVTGSGTASVSVTTSTSDAVVGCVSSSVFALTDPGGNSDTKIFEDSTSGIFGGNFETGGGSPHSLTWAGSSGTCPGTWVYVGVDVVAAGASSPPWDWEAQPEKQFKYAIGTRAARIGAIASGLDGHNSYIEAKAQRFFRAGWEIQPWQPPHPILNQRAAIQHRTGFRGSSLQPAGWEVQPWQPPFFPKTNQKIGIVSEWEDGTEYTFQRFKPAGWEIQPPQPPFFPKTNQKIAALSQWEDGIEAKFVFTPVSTIKFGWEVQPWQPPFFRAIARFPALTAHDDDSKNNLFHQFFPAGWEVQPYQPPAFLKPNLRAGAWSQWEDGIEARYVNFLPSGWEIQPPQPPHPRPEKAGSILPWINIDPVYVNWINFNWEVQPPQPPFFPKTNQKISALSQWEDGTEYSLQKFFPAGWEVQPPQPPFFPKTNQKISALSQWEDGIEAKFVFIPSQFPNGWEVQPWQPPYPRFKNLDRGDEGIEYPFQRFFPGGWEVQPPQPPFFPKTNQKISALSQWEDGIEYPFQRFFPAGWEIQPPPPPFFLKTNQRIGALSQWEDGIEAKFIFTPPGFQAYGWEVLPWQPPYPRWKNLDRGDEGTQYPFQRFFPAGWEVQPPPPPYSRWKNLDRGDEGIEYPLQRFFPGGWEVQPYQPPAFLKPNLRAGAWSQWEDGIEHPLVAIPPGFLAYGWEVLPWQPPYPRWKNLDRGDDGIEYPFQRFFPSGWEIQPPPPPYSRWKNLDRGDEGIEYPFQRFFPGGWEVQPYQPPFFPKTNQKISALSQWEDGIEAVYVFIPAGFQAYGWEVQPWQPPHFRPEVKAASFLRGDEGIEYPFQNFFPGGWEVQPYQPPHPFVEKRGMFLRGDDGTEYPFQKFFPGGWEVQPWQPPFFPNINLRYSALSHPEEGIEAKLAFVPLKFPLGWVVEPWQPPFWLQTKRKGGATSQWEDGIENIYKFVPPPTPHVFEWLTRYRRRGRR